MTTETEGVAEAVAEFITHESEEPVVETATEAEADTQTAEEEAEPEAQEAPKPKKTAQERIGELTYKAREAERRAAELERQLAEANATRPAPEGDEPSPDAYEYGETDVQYIRDLARYEARQEHARLNQQANAQAEQQRVADAWNRAQAEAAAKYEDFDDVVGRPDLSITPLMAQVMMEAGKEGAEIAYHLGKNPAEARRIAALSPTAQARELGKLEVQLAAKPAPKLVTDAPTPAPLLRASGGQFAVAADTTDFAAFEKMAVARSK